MFVRALLLAGCLIVSQPSFADPVPVPANKSAYVGEWLGEKMRLKLHQDGKVEYKRDQPGKNVSLSIELQGFNGDNFDAGWGIVHSTFVVSTPPHRDHGKWKMTVDGVELTKVD
jgi:hypothetical protein